jgi:3',5'-cyclic-AMP phosphodiesterase
MNLTEDAMASPKDEILYDHNHDGIDRRGFLRCMAWAGTGALCVLDGGVLTSYALGRGGEKGVKIPKGELAFVQISDSHMGFDKPANPDVVATFQAAIDKINALPVAPEFILHTGDVSHLAKAAQFDNVEQILKSARTQEVFYVPGEHDFVGDEGQQFREPFGKGTQGGGTALRSVTSPIILPNAKDNSAADGIPCGETA